MKSNVIKLSEFTKSGASMRSVPVQLNRGGTEYLSAASVFFKWAIKRLTRKWRRKQSLKWKGKYL